MYTLRVRALNSLFIPILTGLQDRGLVQGAASCFNGLGLGLGGFVGGLITDRSVTSKYFLYSLTNRVQARLAGSLSAAGTPLSYFVLAHFLQPPLCHTRKIERNAGSIEADRLLWKLYTPHFRRLASAFPQHAI